MAGSAGIGAEDDKYGVPESFQFLIGRAIDAAAEPGRWILEADDDESAWWIRVHSRGAATPDQGWKLHVSAYGSTAGTVLERVLPVLLNERATFKVARSVAVLDRLNEGEGGDSQTGKFVTVYPESDPEAVRLAARLHDVTTDLVGPPVPSDRPLKKRSLLHYRYGSNGQLHMQTPLGEILPALINPRGELEPDRRTTLFRPPGWVVDPFESAGVADELAEPTLLIEDRYLLVSLLHRTPRSRVHLSADLHDKRRCVVKSLTLEGPSEPNGGSREDRLRHEAAILARLHAGGVRVPQPFGVVVQDDSVHLAMQDLDGVTLEQQVNRRLSEGTLMSADQVTDVGLRLASLLGTTHDLGVIHRDVKSANVMIDPDGELWLLDFDIAHEVGDPSPVRGRGTPGYISPQQQAGDTPSVLDDVFALGAVMYFVTTGAEPSQAPRTSSLLDRPVRLMNPAVGRSLPQVIARCLDPDPSKRYRSMGDVEAALRKARQCEDAPAVSHLEDTRRATHYFHLARRLGETLQATAAGAPPEDFPWLSAHPVGGGGLAQDVGTGKAGTLLVMAELADAFDSASWRETVRDASLALLDSASLPGAPRPGLFVGEAGVAAALLRAGQVLQDEELIRNAVQRGQWIGTLPHSSPDLYNGSAGRVRLHLLLWDETHEGDQLALARAAGDFILARAGSTGAGGKYWKIPDGYSGLSGQANLGYAHGAAGIADAALDLYEACADRRYLEAARAAGQWMATLAVPVDGDRGVAWPVNEGEQTAPPFWCHGAAGIGRFLLHLSQVDPGSAQVRMLAEKAGFAAASHARWANPSQCHGLAGNIEFLIDLYQVTGRPQYLHDALAMARIMEAFSTEAHGGLVWASDASSIITPDYWVGYAGVAACLLRLADPLNRPHLMSRAGFRFRPG